MKDLLSTEAGNSLTVPCAVENLRICLLLSERGSGAR